MTTYVQTGMFNIPLIGLDWLTVTTRSVVGRAELQKAVDKVLASKEGKGVTIKPWHWRGYEGIFAEGVRHGKRDDSDIAILSGEKCQSYWKAFTSGGFNCTRLDVALDVEYVHINENIADMCRSQFEVWQNGRKQRMNATFVVNLNGGKTFYIGSRESDRFCRIYDKGAQRGGLPGKLWRFEVEYKGSVAKNAWAVLESSDTPITDMVSWVRAELLSRGVTIPFLDNSSEVQPRLKALGLIKSEETTLQWLRTQVRPSLLKLIETGRIEDIESALGFQLYT